ncbi:MAG: hypothetical protein ABR884_01835 [Minisyncoccia bacterium]
MVGFSRLTKIQRVILVLFIFVVFLYCFNQFASADTFYDLRAGQLIWQTGQIPHADVFSFTATGAEWIPHEWLAQLIFYGVQSAIGFWGLMAFVAALAAGAYYLLFSLAMRKGANFYITLLVLFASGAAGFTFWIPRPQSIVFLLCVALVYLLERYRIRPRVRYLYGAVLLVLLWANINASVMLAIGIIALFLVAGIANERRWSPPLKYLLCTLLASVGMAFVNPSGYKIFTYGLIILPSIKAFGVSEWQPLTAYWAGWDTKVFVVAIIAAALFLVWRLGRKAPRDWVWIALVVATAIAPFIAARYLIFWSLFVVPPLAWVVSDAARDFLNKISPKLFVVAAFMILAVLLIVRYVTFPGNYVDDVALPVHAANFLAENGAQGNAFNVYAQGGYLLWRLWPQVKIAMDGRSEVYLGAPTEEYYAILHDAPSAAGLISQKYNIQYFIFPYDPAFLAGIHPLISYLEKNNWRLVWWDDGAVVFAKDDQQNQTFIANYALRYVGPFTDPSTINATDTPLAVTELRSLIDRAPDSVVVADYISSFLASHPTAGLSR